MTEKKQITSDSKRIVHTPKDIPQELVDHLGREFEREQRLWEKAIEKMRNARK